MTLYQKSKNLDWKPIIIFITIAFIPAWILFGLPAALQAVGLENARIIRLVGWSAAMWMPGAGAVLTTWLVEKKSIKQLGLNRLGKPKIFFLAWLVPILAAILTGLFTWLLGWGKFKVGLADLQQSLNGTGEIPVIDSGWMLGIIIGLSMIFPPLLNTLFALGEELGWRGYLLPKLLGLGQIPAVVVSGTIWGIWHAPAILQGHNYPDHPILGAGMMIVFCVWMGIFFSWLFLRTKSPWAPALGHGTLNAVAGLPLLFLSDVDILRGGSLTSVTGWIVLALVNLALIASGEFPLKDLNNVSRETQE